MAEALKPCPFCGNTDQIDFGMHALHCDDCGASVSDNAWNTRPLEDAKDAEIAALTAEVARLTALTTWIPVGERLPEYGSEVLAVDSVHDIAVCKSDNSSLWWKEDCAGALSPTHWMMLPAFPEVQK